jgi:hypothetical protein
MATGGSTLPRVSTPYTRRLTAANEGPADRADRAAAQALVAGGLPATYTTLAGPGTINQYRTQNIANIANTQRAAMAPRTAAPTQRLALSSSGSSGGRRRGGGGGGGAATPLFSQSMLDWAAQLMQGVHPQALTANTLDLPDYQGMPVRPFDNSMYQQALTALGEGQATDTATANQATQNMLSFLNNNYVNAFNNPNQTYSQAPVGMDQAAMARLLQSQGVDPNVMAQTANEGVQANAAFGNMWRALAGNEDIMQRSRLANAQQYGNQAIQAINAAAAGGRLGINLGQAQAQAAWQQRADDRAYQDSQIQQQIAQQEALQNWQRANQVQDTNAQNLNSYNNAVAQAMLGLLPQIQGNPALHLPTLQALGLAA